jgi:pantothenate kinase
MTATPLIELYARVDELTADGKRRILGLCGAPGSGKSTLAALLAEHARERGVIVPMDGFHLANSELARIGRSRFKGAEDTFDSAGYVALLRRLRDQGHNEIVYAPEFRREVEEAIAGAIPIFAEQPLVITEGNYLLLDRGHWSEIRPLVDEIWYVDVAPELRLRRLIARHMQFGRDEAAAREWVERNDETNAALIASTGSRADRVVSLPAFSTPTEGVPSEAEDTHPVVTRRVNPTRS